MIHTYFTRHSPPPNGVAVIVAGGIAMRKTGGEWFTGMEEPLFQRKLGWEPHWWAHIPTRNEPARLTIGETRCADGNKHHGPMGDATLGGFAPDADRR